MNKREFIYYNKYGVEIVEEAIQMAKENAKINNVQNTEFLAGDFEIKKLKYWRL